MIKRISAFILALIMLLSLAACSKEEKKPAPTQSNKSNGAKIVNNKIKKGEPGPVGDVFEYADIEGAAGAPVIGQITPQANPDDSIMLAGEGFSASGLKAFVYTQSKKDNGKAMEAEFTVIDDTKMQLAIPKDAEYGVYAVYLQNASGKSNVKFVNTPDVWFIGYNYRTSGEEIDIYGENLTSDNKTDTSVFLVADGEYCELSIAYADPYKITAITPDTLTVDKEYEIYVHNGHGGEYGFAKADKKIKYVAESAVMFEGDVIDVTEYGADPEDSANDDTQAVKDAIRAAQAGDTVYFPAGVYFLSETIEINQSIRVCGANKLSTVIIMANAVKDSLFEVKAAPTEFINLGFWHKRTTGALRGNFIRAFHVEPLDYEYSLKVTNCKFVQSVEAASRSMKHAVYAQDADGVIMENNEIDATGILGSYGCSRVRLRNNKALMSCYVGSYYNQNTTFFVNVDQLDFSNNVIQGKDILDDPTGMLKTDNMTPGRSVAVQGFGTNMYFYNNKFERTGLPDDNAGEQIMLENLGCVYDGGISAADANSVTNGT